MAQVTGAVARSNFKVEVSVNGTLWVDISGAAAGVTFDGGEGQVGEQMTADGEYAIVTPGQKIEPTDITVSCVYTGGAAEAFLTVWAQWIGTNKRIGVRWYPDAAGTVWYVTSIDGAAAAIVPILSCDMPELDASSGDPALFEFSVKAPAIFKGTGTVSQKPIELDAGKLTIGDWEVIEAMQEGKVRVTESLGIVARCSNWTVEEFRTLPAGELTRIFEAIAIALASEIKQKN